MSGEERGVAVDGDLVVRVSPWITGSPIPLSKHIPLTITYLWLASSLTNQTYVTSTMAGMIFRLT